MSEETNIPQMRETIERLSKDKAGLETQVKEQAVALRVHAASDAFRGAGYNPNHGKLYAAVNPEGEITAETVVAFAEEQTLSPVDSDTQKETDDGGEATSEVKDGSEALSGMAGSGSRAGDGGAGGAQVETLTRQAWQQLYAEDPAAAQAAVASGRVEISRDNVYVKGVGIPKGTNPYVVEAPAS